MANSKVKSDRKGYKFNKGLMSVIALILLVAIYYVKNSQIKKSETETEEGDLNISSSSSHLPPTRNSSSLPPPGIAPNGSSEKVRGVQTGASPQNAIPGPQVQTGGANGKDKSYPKIQDWEEFKKYYGQQWSYSLKNGELFTLTNKTPNEKPQVVLDDTSFVDFAESLLPLFKVQGSALVKSNIIKSNLLNVVHLAQTTHSEKHLEVYQGTIALSLLKDSSALYMVDNTLKPIHLKSEEVEISKEEAEIFLRDYYKTQIGFVSLFFKRGPIVYSEGSEKESILAWVFTANIKTKKGVIPNEVLVSAQGEKRKLYQQRTAIID